MTNPQTETKIELVTEAIEALVLASVTLNHQNVLDARGVLKSALRDFLTPTLRIIERIDQCGDATRTFRHITGVREIAEHVPYGGKGIDGMDL